MKFQTTEAYVSGAIVGSLWMPACTGGIPFHGDIRRQLDRFSDSRGATFRDVLLHMLMEHGGDFRNAQFAADTVIHITRRTRAIDGKYSVHVREREVATLPDCDDLVSADVYTSDVFADD